MSAKRNGPTVSGEAASTKLANFGTAQSTGLHASSVVLRDWHANAAGWCGHCNAQTVIDSVGRRGRQALDGAYLVHEPGCPSAGGGNRAARRRTRKRGRS